MSQFAIPAHSPFPMRSVVLALAAAAALLFAVAFDQGQLATWVTAAAAGDSTVHEYFHDARHMLGFPCH